MKACAPFASRPWCAATEVAVAQRGDEVRGEVERAVPVLDHDEVVPRPVPLGEAQFSQLAGTPSARRRCRPRPPARPGTTGCGGPGGTRPAAAGPAPGSA